MNRTIRLGQLAGLKVMMKGNVVVGWLLVWLVFTGGALWGLKLSGGTAVLVALLASILHFLFELWHCLSHSVAARRTGYPMSAIMYRWVLGGTLYPRDEPELPAAVHIKRAIGGPIGSLLLALLLGLFSLPLRAAGGLLYGLAVYGFWSNLLFFTIGAMLPLGFTDGSTILRYWGKD
ncbi:MAG: hypothetical protein H6658_10385 [Ardenticatenaceae bacterium]|nr:hypothetical protein [Ardenticatenaceae bacterium]